MTKISHRGPFVFAIVLFAFASSTWAGREPTAWDDLPQIVNIKFSGHYTRDQMRKLHNNLHTQLFRHLELAVARHPFIYPACECHLIGILGGPGDKGERMVGVGSDGILNEAPAARANRGKIINE